MKVDDIARIWPGTRMVFTRHNLDLCSGGTRPLEFVVKEHGLNLDSVLAELNAAGETPFPVLQEQLTPCAHPRPDGGPGINEGGKETSNRITADTTVPVILKRYPAARRIFDQHGLRGCGGEEGPAEKLEFFARVHQVDLQALLRDLQAEIESPAPREYVYQETLADVIYRRFFKAGIVVVLSVGALWGAINLLQIALDEKFLQLRLVPSIHAHAHAMIFGWVGLFVMGFAYQSFPRFKSTTLWRPDLANATFYLMLAGIVARMSAELIQPDPWGLALGLGSSLAELAAIGMFVAIILKTARQSIQPHNPYEKFIFGALGWFLIQAILSDFFFFAKATAVSEEQLIRRIALIDGPLRDIQLLGFVALIIAGVSQRFVPVVYNLGRPRRDRQNLIFWAINGSLLLDVASYVLVVSTYNPVFVIGLELSYILMFVWAVLLARQLGIFSAPAERDRSWKFIRAAYTWLLVALGMLPFFPIYSLLTRQYFAHSYMGAYRHAYTVGFVSLMIMGVAARVVPILAGMDSKKVSPLWGPFILINAGCAGRVVLQILSDFVPSVAYSLVGLTGFIEFAALAWWGIDLWHSMNLAKTLRPKLLGLPVAPVAT
jgi:iron-sulfur cluster repair protein YtfE (RIC family)